MTDAEREPLNERIALRLGWTFHPENPFEERWLHPSRLWSLHTHPPDFTRKWEHAGPLLEEMFKELESIEPELALDDMRIIQEQSGCDLTEAIAVAFDAWREGEKG